jgi:hypothetical protein
VYPTLHAADLTGDGRIGLLVLYSGRLYAFRDGLDDPFWTWELPGPGSKVLDVRPSGPSRPTTVQVQSGDAVFGVAGPTGRPRWRCDGPGPVVGVVADGDGPGPAAVAFASGDATVVREALPTDDDGHALPAEPTPTPGRSQIINPWLARPLPWARGQPLLGNCFAAAFVGLLAFLWWKRRRKTAAVLAAAALLLGVGLSGWLLRWDAASKGADEFYVWDDWYGAMAVVAAVLGGLTVFVLGVPRLVRASGPPFLRAARAFGGGVGRVGRWTRRPGG